MKGLKKRYIFREAGLNLSLSKSNQLKITLQPPLTLSDLEQANFNAKDGS